MLLNITPSTGKERPYAMYKIKKKQRKMTDEDYLHWEDRLKHQ